MDTPFPKDEKLFSPDELEGEYTTWVFVWDRDYSAVGGIYHPLVDNYGTVYGSDGPVGIGLRIRTYAGVEVWDATERCPWANQEEGYSANRKYVLTEETAVQRTLRVWRKGVLIFSRLLTLDRATFNRINEIWMSPNGKFIAIAADDTVSGANSMLFLYEGNP